MVEDEYDKLHTDDDEYDKLHTDRVLSSHNDADGVVSTHDDARGGHAGGVDGMSNLIYGGVQNKSINLPFYKHKKIYNNYIFIITV